MNEPVFHPPVTVALTGASGAQYGLRLIEALVAAGHEVWVMVSKAAHLVIETETDTSLPARPERLAQALRERSGAAEGQIRCFGREDWMAPVASGSGAPSAMVICPCSTGTLSAVATGASNNLIERAADVALKERRQLILVPRETPLSAIHLEHAEPYPPGSGDPARGARFLPPAHHGGRSGRFHRGAHSQPARHRASSHAALGRMSAPDISLSS